MLSSPLESEAGRKIAAAPVSHRGEVAVPQAPSQPSALAGDGGEPPAARLDTELGYGLLLSGGLTGTPYVGLGLGEARDYRLGWRLTSGRWPSFSLGVQAARREAANHHAPEHRIGLEAGLRW